MPLSVRTRLVRWQQVHGLGNRQCSSLNKHSCAVTDIFYEVKVVLIPCDIIDAVFHVSRCPQQAKARR